MAHYALLDENNVVISVIVGKDEDEVGSEDWEKEYEKATGYVCKRTSYNTWQGTHKEGKTPFRKNYAGIGFTYDYERDAFIPPKPLESFVLHEATCTWQEPIPYPNDGNAYIWNEEMVCWDLYVE